MPTIPQYEAPQGIGLHPSETGINATAGAARRLQGDYSEAAAAIAGTGRRIASAVEGAGDMAVKYIDHQQISAGQRSLAELTNVKTQEWNNTVKNADPNDPTVAKKFVEENLEPALDKFKQGFITEKGQQFAESHADALRQHMYAKTSADMATMAGEAVHQNTRATINNLAGAAYNDPSSLDFAINTLDSTLEHVVGSSPNLTGTAAGKVKTEISQAGKEAIVKAAVMGMITKNPDTDLDAIQKKYGQYINGAEMGQFARAAKAQAKSDQLTAKQLEQYQIATQVREGKDALAKVFTDNISFDENGHATIKPELFQQSMDVAKKFTDPRGQPLSEVIDHARVLINYGQAQQREKREIIVTDKAVQSNLYDGLFKTDNPTTDVDILKAAAENKLDPHATSTLMNLYKALEERPLKGPIYQNTMEAAKGILGTNTVMDGHERYSNFLQQFIPTYLSLSDKERVGALDTRNPDSLISKSMAPFKPTQQQMIMGRALKNLGIGVEPTGELINSLTAPTKPAFVPPPDWQWNPARRQYKDPAGKIHDASGNLVK